MRWIVMALLLVPLTVAVPDPSDAPERFTSDCLDDHARRFVYDYTGLIPQQGGRWIEQRHCDAYQTTSVHFVVVIAADDEGDIERLAIELFEEWGIGDADRLDGLLLLLAPSDQGWNSRLEVGYGIEHLINAVAARDALGAGAVAYNGSIERGDAIGDALTAYIEAVGGDVIPRLEPRAAVVSPQGAPWPMIAASIGLFFLGGAVYLSRNAFRKTNAWGDVEHTRLDHFFAGLTWREGDWVPDEGHVAYKTFRWGRRFRYLSFIILVIIYVFSRRAPRGGFGGGRSGGGGGTGRF